VRTIARCVISSGTPACGSDWNTFRGQRFAALCSARPEPHRCAAATGTVMRGGSVWRLKESKKSCYNQLQRGDLFQLETNARRKLFTDPTRSTTAGSIRQKLNQLHFPKPQCKPPDAEGSSRHAQQRRSNRSQLIQTGPNTRRGGVTRHTSQGARGVSRFWQGNEVFDPRGTKARRVSSSGEQSTFKV